MSTEKDYRVRVTFDRRGRVENVRWGDLAGPVGPALTPAACPMDPHHPAICPPKMAVDLRFTEFESPEIGLRLDAISRRGTDESA